MVLNLILLIKSSILIFSVYLAVKFIEWLLEYIKNLRTYHDIKGWPIIPVIGNLDKVKNNGVDFLKIAVEMSLDFHKEAFFRIYRGWEPVIIFHKADYLDVIEILKLKSINLSIE